MLITGNLRREAAGVKQYSTFAPTWLAARCVAEPPVTYTQHRLEEVDRVASSAVPPIGARLRAERRRRDVPVRGLAREIGVSASLISQIETEKSSPSVSTLYAITTALGISIEDLFGDPPAEELGVDGAGADDVAINGVAINDVAIDAAEAPDGGEVNGERVPALAVVG